MKTSRSKVIFRLILISFLLQFCIEMNCQDKELMTIDSICQVAIRADFDSGIELLDGQLEKCLDTQSSVYCYILVNFTTAYIYQQHAASQKEEKIKTNLLKKSLQYYSYVLDTDQNNINTMVNMAVVEKDLGNLDTALVLINKVIEATYGNKSKYYNIRGDIYATKKDFLTAAEEYKKAFDFDFHRETICYKVFTLYLDSIAYNDGHKFLVNFSQELLAMEMINLARNGFILAINSSLENDSLQNAEKDCLKWANALSKKDNINQSFASELPDTTQWNSKCNIEIKGLLTGRFGKETDFVWWTENETRSHVLATLMLNLERNALLEGMPDKGIILLKEGLKIAPDIHFYDDHSELQNEFPIKVNIAIEFARLYNIYPDRIDHEEYDRLIDNLFKSKASHYLKRDIRSIQRSHTMLGLIYADRGEWESNSFARNAIFQLSRAISYQNRLVRKDPKAFRPIPTLHLKLALGSDVINDKSTAYEMYVDAVAGFLDLDNLSIADSLIRFLKNHRGQNRADKARLLEMEEITNVRLKIRNNQYRFDQADISRIEEDILAEPIFNKSEFKNDSSFLNRQRFKILADAGFQIKKENPVYMQSILEAMSLKYISKEKALGGFQDIDRFKYVEKQFANNFIDEKAVVVKKENPYDVKSAINNFTFYSGNGYSNVQVSQDLFIAGEIQANIRENKFLTPDKMTEYFVRNGTVILPNLISNDQTVDSTMILEIKGVIAVSKAESNPLDRNYYLRQPNNY